MARGGCIKAPKWPNLLLEIFTPSTDLAHEGTWDGRAPVSEARAWTMSEAIAWAAIAAVVAAPATAAEGTPRAWGMRD